MDTKITQQQYDRLIQLESEVDLRIPTIPGESVGPSYYCYHVDGQWLADKCCIDFLKQRGVYERVFA